MASSEECNIPGLASVLNSAWQIWLSESWMQREITDAAKELFESRYQHPSLTQ